MVAAARQGLAGRAPLQVTATKGGFFDIVDGNATAQVLMLVAWDKAPVELLK